MTAYVWRPDDGMAAGAQDGIIEEIDPVDWTVSIRHADEIEGEAGAPIVTDGVSWRGETLPGIGDEVELVDLAGVLYAQPSTEVPFDPDTWLPGSNDDALHIVSDAEPEPVDILDPLPVNGSPPTQAGSWVAVHDADWQTLWAADAVELTRAGGTSGTATLQWHATVPADPGTTLRVSVSTAALAGAVVSVQLSVTLWPAPTFDPSYAGSQTFPGPVFPLTVGPESSVHEWDFIVPDTAQAPPAAPFPPVAASLSLSIAGDVGTTVRIEAITAATTGEGFPVGSIWFNPTVGEGMANLVTTGTASSTTKALPATTAYLPIPAPQGYRVKVTAPPDVSGVVLVFAGFVAYHKSAAIGVTFRINSTPPVTSTLYARTYETDNHTGWHQFPIHLTAWAPLAAGASTDIFVEYAYTAANPVNLSEVLLFRMFPLFLPNAQGAAAGPMGEIGTRYWDGDSWRQRERSPALLEARQEGTTPAPSVTTMNLTKNYGHREPGQSVRITAAVTPNSASGSVSFSRSESQSGPWKGIGSTNLPAGSGSCDISWTCKAGDWYFKAVYAGNASFQSCSDTTNTALDVS